MALAEQLRLAISMEQFSMVDLNIVNFFTIGIIAILAWAGFQFAMNAAGINISWLNG